MLLRTLAYTGVGLVAESATQCLSEARTACASLTNYVKESDLWRYDSPGVDLLLEAIQPSKAGEVAPNPEHEPESDAEPVESESLLPVIPGGLPVPFTVSGEGEKQCA